MTRILPGLLSAAVAWLPMVALDAAAQAAPQRVRLVGTDAVLTATLDVSPSASDFLSLLPLDLTLEDYAATEKIAYLPRKLTTSGAPEVTRPQAGDLAYYAPWGNLALFHRGAAPARGLIRLGRLDGDLAPLRRPGPMRLRIERLP
jgi:hypothetical protein